MIKSSFTLPKYRTTIFLVLALLVLYVISRYNYLLFHSLADGVSIVIAACVFAIIWNGRRIADNDYFLYVGIAFLFFAFWDLMHLLGNKNMGVFPMYGNLGPALYIVSRYLLSISLLLAPLFINRKLNTTLMFAAYLLVTSLVLLSIFYWHIFPVCIIEGVGLTPFKILSDYIICLILLGAIGLLFINRRSFNARVLRLIVFSITLSIATGLAFTLYADPFGIMNAIGHFFQIASFYLTYLAFIETSLTRPQDILYQKLKKNEEKLAEHVEQLNNANAVLEQEVTERKRAEGTLQETQAILQAALDNSQAGIAIADAPGGALRYVNNAGLLIRGGDRQTVVNGVGIDQYVANWQLMNLDGSPMKPDEVPLARTILFGETCSREFIIRRTIDDDRTVFANASPIRNAYGEVKAGIVVFMDITERRRAEEKVEASLREKETLLKEIHHRVKNNLQIISSLLNLQAKSIGDEKLEGIFRECQDRIAAMAAVHQLLYKSQNFAEINFGEYLRETASHLFRSYKICKSTISLVIQAENVMLPIDTAIPCGLIINELVTNALKYAFPGVSKGEIKIEMSKTKQGIRLLFEDNGIGFPKDVDFSNSGTLGLKLIHLLVKQLDGSIEQFINGGTKYAILLKPETPDEEMQHAEP